MIHDCIEFHNVAELFLDEKEGLRLQRVPESVRQHLNDRAQMKMLAAAATEIRFAADGDRVTVRLSSEEGCELIPFFGPLQGKDRIRIEPEARDIEITVPERFEDVDLSAFGGSAFSTNVWRLTLRGNDIRYHGIEGEGLRPPEPDELPSIRYLSYGTSITHGAAATASHLTYVAQAAWRLGADLINLGLGGSAWCEPELADYIGDRDDWDVASLALSVNMIGGGFGDDEFRERVTYMVEQVAGRHPDRPVACITLYPHFRDFGRDQELADKSRRFRQILRDVHGELNLPNTRLFKGTDLLEPGGLSVDLIHPGDLGMIQMGEGLAAGMKEMMESQT